MNNIRKYGSKPLSVAVVHGGPGAVGEMASVAKEISAYRGVLEPFQTALTIEDQIQELKSTIEEYSRPPITLIGFSWGAWLIFILAAQYPALAIKLILVGSGPFKAKYAQNIMKVRLDRLNKKEKTEAQELLEELNNSTTEITLL